MLVQLCLVTKLIDEFTAEYSYITNQGSLFYFKTNLDAPNGKVVCIDLENPERNNWTTVLPENLEDPLGYVECFNEKYLCVCYTHNVHDVLHLYTLKGEFVKEIPLPSLGSVAGIAGRKEDAEFFFKFDSFTYPGSSFRYDCMLFAVVFASFF